MSKEWTSVLGDALNESGDLKHAIIGGVSERLVRSAIEDYLNDTNTFMSTYDAYQLVIADPSGIVSDIIAEYGSIAEIPGAEGDNLSTVVELIAERAAYRMVESATTSELDELLETLDDVETDGYTIDDLGTGSCALGWLPHQSESDDYGGSLAYWKRPEGGSDAWVLYLTVGDARVWFRLSKEEEATDDA